jgi:hypothetical protein
MRPIEAQTNNWNGKTFASPELTISARATIAAAIPISPQNIHPGKNAPNRLNDGAPRRMDLSEANAGHANEIKQDATHAAVTGPRICVKRDGLHLADEGKDSAPASGHVPRRLLPRHQP